MKNAKGKPSFTKFLAVVLFCTMVFSMTACATTNNTNDSLEVVVDNQPGSADQQSPQDPQPPQQQETPPNNAPEADPPSDNDDTITVPAGVQWLIGRWAMVEATGRVGEGLHRLMPFLSIGADGIAWEGTYVLSGDTEVVLEGSRVARFDNPIIDYTIIGPWTVEGNDFIIERSPEAVLFGVFAPRTWILEVVSEDKILLRQPSDPNLFSTLRRFVD